MGILEVLEESLHGLELHCGTRLLLQVGHRLAFMCNVSPLVEHSAMAAG
jgi:hypothetical protein